MVAKKNEARMAVVAAPLEKDYVKKVIPKSHSAKKLIFDAIKHNILFRSCSAEELVDLVDAFAPKEYPAGAVVIKQGDEGNQFYVVESGTLDISVQGAKIDPGLTYDVGSAFGELALMYGSPRAATIRTRTSCLLWFLERRDYRGITGQHKLKQMNFALGLVKNLRFGDKILGEVMKASEIDAMVLATQSRLYKKDDVLIREGERGDMLYIIESGTVEVFKKSNGDKPIATMKTGQFFGEKALLSEDVRQATCIASSDLKCLMLTREDFNLMLGDLKELLDASSTAQTRETSASGIDDKLVLNSSRRFKIEVADLELKRTLGVGAFGRVKLAKLKPSAAQKVGPSAPKTYALKCLSKKSIVDNLLKDHVMNERSIMGELDHPFIIGFYCAMQDESCIYFLLEVLLGGELFKILRAEGKFSEEWCCFYSASVLLAFCEMHSKKIAYRDLKPENLVMDSQGYLKIVDFGLAKKIEGGKTWTLCGTPDYLAPEIILNEGHDWAVDYWAFGVLIYEMAAGAPPFYANDVMDVYAKILSGNVVIPPHFSRGLGDLVKKLLKTYQSKRLGRTKGGTGAIMQHNWYSGFDWEGLLEKRMKVPILPRVKNPEDTSNFDNYPEDDSLMEPFLDWVPIL